MRSAVRKNQEENINDSANGFDSGRYSQPSSRRYARFTNRPFGQFLCGKFARERGFRSRKRKFQRISSVNAYWDHGVEFRFETRIGRCTGSPGQPI
jgi:hypothetical protein